MIETRRKFERLIGNVRRLIEHPKISSAYRDLRDFAQKLDRLAPELATDSATVRVLLDFILQLRASKVRWRWAGEEDLLRFLRCLAAWHLPVPDKNGGPLDDFWPPDEESDRPLVEAMENLREIHEFAIGCFSFKQRRDAHAGQRRALAFEILSATGPVGDASQTIALAGQSMQDGDPVEARAAVEFLKEHFADPDMALDDSLIDAIWRLIHRGRSENEVFAGLDTLLDWGVIDGLEAVVQLDKWREKHSGD